MKIIFRWGKSALVVAALMVAGAANASSFTAASDGGGIWSFGAPDTTTYGETFNLSNQSNVQDWTYYAQSGNAGNLQFVIASWDGTKAVGPALYSSSSFSYGGGSQALDFSGINTILGAGSYIAYITTAGLSNAVTGVTMAGSNENGGLGGAFWFNNSNGADPLTSGTAWSGFWLPPNLAFTANISSVSAVPLPPSIAMMFTGLGLVGFMTRRRKGKTADIA